LPIKNQVKVGDIAGNIDNGRVKIWIDNKRYYAHRLAFLYVYGEFPCDKIDHFNGNPTDNSIKNLRNADNQLNNENLVKAYKNNLTGLLGVGFNKRKKRFIARIMVNRKSIFLGYFDCAENAHKAYVEAKRKYHPGCTI
jgi:hypothetical protein